MMAGDPSPAVTVVYVDIRPFVKILKEVLGGGGEVRAQLWEQIGLAVEEFRGVVRDRRRRTMVALWGLGESQEDAAVRAVQATLAMHKVMHGMCVGIVETDWPPIRIGISTGAVVIAPNEESENDDSTVAGAAVSLAEQLAQHADGKILIEYETFLAVRDAFEIEPVSSLVLETQAALPVYRVLRARVDNAQE